MLIISCMHYKNYLKNFMENLASILQKQKKTKQFNYDTKV